MKIFSGIFKVLIINLLIKLLKCSSSGLYRKWLNLNNQLVFFLCINIPFRSIQILMKNKICKLYSKSFNLYKNTLNLYNKKT